MKEKIPFCLRIGGTKVAPVESVGNVKTWSKMSAKSKVNQILKPKKQKFKKKEGHAVEKKNK